MRAIFEELLDSLLYALLYLDGSAVFLAFDDAVHKVVLSFSNLLREPDLLNVDFHIELSDHCIFRSVPTRDFLQNRSALGESVEAVEIFRALGQLVDANDRYNVEDETNQGIP